MALSEVDLHGRPQAVLRQEALQPDDKEDKGLHGILVTQVVARDQDQGGEHEEARAEYDEPGIDADGEVGSRLGQI